MSGDIEFLDESADDDPDRPGRDGRAPARHRVRRRRALRPVPLLILAAAALTALLVTRAVSSDDRHGPPPRPQPVPSYRLAACSGTDEPPEFPGRAQERRAADGGVVNFALTDGHPTGPVACSRSGAFCPYADDGQNACRSVHTLPDAVVSAVRARFPGASVVDTVTETVRENGRLWYRYVHFRLPPGTDLAVEIVNGHGNDVQTGEWDDGSGLFSRVASKHGSITTVVTVDAPSGAASTLGTQSALARDPALATR